MKSLALDPKLYPEITAPCGCKFIDGTSTDMCIEHVMDMEKWTQAQREAYKSNK